MTTSKESTAAPKKTASAPKKVASAPKKVVAPKKVAKKVAAPKKAAPAPKKKRVGVIASIAEFLLNNKKGLTRSQILDRLAKRFPDRDSIGMAATISVQLPGRMARERKMIITTEGKGPKMKYFASKK